MVNRNLIRNLEDDSITTLVDDISDDWILEDDIIQSEHINFDVNELVKGRILRIDDDHVLVDVGFKSEGTVDLDEWADDPEPPKVGDTYDFLIKDLEDEMGGADDPHGMISVSYRDALQILRWKEIMDKVSEGEVVTGKVTRKIKGGLLVDIGVPVFLPASQVDIRRPGDIGDYIGRFVQCEVLKIDELRQNIVVSRRSLIENERKIEREALLTELEIGQIRKGVVKNIAEFGAFVDLGGIDGLLHITDMSYDRIDHPSQMVSIDQEIQVMVLHIDRERAKIALGLKQMQPNPWEHVVDKYPVNSKVQGEVVNVMTYGAFVKLEPGIEGLVHISEMSWIKRVNHPSELVNIGDMIEVVILGVDKEGQQLSLGMKQTQSNPWDKVIEKYPVDANIKGRVRNLTNYGAFVELEAGIDGLLHVSDMSWVRKISHPSELLEKGQEVECKILSVDQERRRIALGLKQLDDDPWERDIPSRYTPGQLVSGQVTKITNFGVFVGLEEGLEGLLHISELAEHKVENPEDVVKVGDEIEVKVLRVDTEDRKIGLSRKRVEWAEEDEAAAAAEEAAAEAAGGTASTGGASSAELKGGLGASGPLISTSMAKDEETSAPDPEMPSQTVPEPETASEPEATSEESSSEDAGEAEEKPSEG
jgi:small subunit ribosomal protein S1